MGAKTTLCLFSIAAAGPAMDLALHGKWVADLPGYQTRDARIILYHLRMASPLRRQFCRDLYATADPGRRFQPLGYDYLADERGVQLRPAGSPVGLPGIEQPIRRLPRKWSVKQAPG